MPEFQKVAVLGLGYKGCQPLPSLQTAACGFFLGVDVNEEVVKMVTSGVIPIAEPDLAGLVQKVVSTGSLSDATTSEEANVFVLALPTPIDKNKRPDLRCVMAAVDSLTAVLRSENLAILEN
jgi:UDP-N-acetyl-D-mannosaminuronic acid dehydrogenase